MLKSFNVEIANLKIKIEHKYDFLPQFCCDYIINSSQKVDIYAKSTEFNIQQEHIEVPNADIAVCESLCVYRDIAEKLPNFDRFVFHGAAIKYNGDAYVFTAPSGTGKTTHINLWRKNLGDKVDVINGDKPIIKVEDISTVYGTPWAGKEGLCNNTDAPLKAICILKQSKTNSIKKLDRSMAINNLIQQVYLPKNESALEKTLSLLGKLIENTPIYLFECNISNEAFNSSFDALTNAD